MNYTSIRIEGAILSPDILDGLEDARGQRPKDFGLDQTARVKDEIARTWADAQNLWRLFNRRLESLGPDARATTETRNLWMVPFLGLLGYQLEYQARGEEVSGKLFPISHRVMNRDRAAVHIVGANDPAGLDRKPERMARRVSAHAMLQEYLNLTEELYGIVTNGRVLRLLRDSSRLVRLSYLEFDLERIFTDALFADFAVLFRLLHVTRLPLAHTRAAESIIEHYHQDSLDSGARIRDGLSKAVEYAIERFANGFLAHPDNGRLRQETRSGELAPVDMYPRLLRLIYRLLFLLVIEERNLIFPDQQPGARGQRTRRDIYLRHYSLQRLRRLSEKRHLATDRHHDLWLSLLATFRLFEDGGPGHKLGIAPLAGDLFAPEAIGLLGECTLANHVLLDCLRALGIYRHPDTGQHIRVNYAALNVEEFGSVYEGLLEYEPDFDIQGEKVSFHFRPGRLRAATGSHYTPDDLVQPLLRHSLDHLIAAKRTEPDPAAALLSLRVADVACGSGHILLAAARRIGTELAFARTGQEQPSPLDLRRAIRDAIRHCIYGVDLNPLAVELCKVALWLEAHVPGEPLNFLDHHIKCGNAIVGFAQREALAAGVPDQAFEAYTNMPEEERRVASPLKRRNRSERQQHSLDTSGIVEKDLNTVLRTCRQVTSLPENTPAQIATKKQEYANYLKGPEAWLLRQIASIPIAQFYLPKTDASRLITDAGYQRYRRGEHALQGPAVAESTAMAHRKRFFHWFLEFPEVMEQGGFDCILGNPPYLGGTYLSSTYGYSFCQYIKWEFAPAGLSDLIAYFMRRIFALLKPNGFMAIITTNSIKDGDIRKDGLEQIMAHSGNIIFALRAVKWPGHANLYVSLLSIYKNEWEGDCLLDGAIVKYINSFLDSEYNEIHPFSLIENSGKVFEGFKFIGDGFILSYETGNSLLNKCDEYRDVIYPLINGHEINSNPTQYPGRYIINFFNFDIEDAQKYIDPFKIIEETVKPVRATNKRVHYRIYWWRFAEYRPGLLKQLQKISSCFAATRTTKYLNFSSFPKTYAFSDAINVFTTDRWDLYAIVQCTLHEVWARKYSGALKQDLRYSPSNCFRTFAFPEGLWQAENPELAALGERYHEHRKRLMRTLWLGLTEIYNLFHAPDLSAEMVADRSGKDVDTATAGYAGLLELRRLHTALDNAVRDAYGWGDLDLGHGFVDLDFLPENDRTRYTISAAARKEVLKRLLLLNHERADQEKQATERDPPAVKKGAGRRTSKKGNGQGKLPL